MINLPARLFNLLSDPLLLIKRDGSILDFNRQAADLLTISAGEKLNIDHFILDPDFCNKLFNDGIADSGKEIFLHLKTIKGQLVSAKVQLFKQDADTFYLLLKKNALLVKHYSNDFKVKPGETESRYRAIFENTMMCIVLLDPDLKIRDFNPVFAEMTGLKPEEFVSNRLSDLVHPVESGEVEQLFRQILNSADRTTTSREMQLVRIDGAVRNTVSYIRCYFDDRLHQEVLMVMFDDISEKKRIAEDLVKSEQKHRMIAEYVLDVIWISDLNLNSSFVSPSIYKFQGYRPAEFLKMPLEKSITSDSLLHARQKMAECYSIILSGEQKAADLKATMEMVYYHKNGSLVHGEVTAVFITDSKGNPTGILGVTRDVSARKQHEAVLLSAKEKAEEANRLKSMFLANVSHEIRTPVSGIIGLTSRLVKQAPDQFFSRQLSSILNSAEMLLIIINDLLDISRIEAGKMELEKIDFDFKQMLSGVTDLFTHKIQEKKLYFHYAIDQKIPRLIKGDPVRISQILINILGNAFKFTEKGGVELSVSRIGRTSRKNPGRLGIRFSVKDTGTGIEADKVPLIFNAFTQADISHTRKYGGTGLGLTIAGRLIEMMGGQIRVQSHFGQGSLFEYDLYLTAVNSDSLGVLENPEEIVLSPETLQGLTVLIAEDNDLNSEYLRMVLEEYGIIPIVTANGREALEKIASINKLDGIIMDVQMPEVDGYQAARALRSGESNFKGVPILGLSASGFPEEERMAIESGMNQFMIKPAKEERLLQWLYSLVDPKTGEQSIIKKTQTDSGANCADFTVCNENDLNLEKLLNKNSQRLSSLQPLVQIMLNTGKSYIADLVACRQNSQNEEFKALAHKFRGRIGIFESQSLLDLLKWLEINCNLVSEIEFSAKFAEFERNYNCFELKLQELNKIISTKLSAV